MQVINYESIVDIPISEVDNNITGGSGEGVAGIDNEKINGATSIYNFPEQEQTSIAGWTTTVSRTPTNYRKVSWTNGNIYLPDGTTLSVTSGNTGNMTALTYIYYNMETMAVETTTTAQDAVGANKLLICVAKPNSVSTKFAEFQAFGTDAQSTFITADNIAANTITANEIASNTITANEMSVSQLSAISADMGTITAGTITGATVRTASSGTRFQMTSSEIAYYYGTKKRVQFTGNGISFYDTSGNDVSLYGYSGNMVTDGNFGVGGYLYASGNIYTDGDMYSTNDGFLGTYSNQRGGAYIDGKIYMNGGYGYFTVNTSTDQVQFNDGSATRYLLASSGSITTGSATAAGIVDVRIGGYWYKLMYSNRSSA